LNNGVRRNSDSRQSLPNAGSDPAWPVCVILAIAAFLVDASTPRGVADGFLYVLPVLACFWVRSAHAALYTAMALMLPLGLGTLISPAGAPLWMEVTNRLLGATTIWLTALLISHNARLTAQRERLLDRVRELNRSSEQNRYAEHLDLSRWLISAVAHNLSAVGAGLDAMTEQQPDQPLIRVLASDARDLIDAALSAVYDKEDEIRVPLDAAELEWFVKRHIDEFTAISGITVTVNGPTHLRVAQDHRAALCNDIVREALVNIGRHADARQVALELREVPEGAFIAIQDDGTGLHSGDPSESMGLGLFRTAERLKAIAGTLKVSNVVPHGVRVEAWVPRGDPTDCALPEMPDRQ
jgi:signal transduction histidine kinase